MDNILSKVKSLTKLGRSLVSYDTDPEGTLRELLPVITDADKLAELNAVIIGVRGQMTAPKAVNLGKVFIKDYIGFVLSEIVLKDIEKSENGLYTKLNDLDAKAKEIKTQMNLDEIMLKHKHFNRDKIAKEFMARKTLAYIKSISTDEEVGLYLPKLLDVLNSIKELDFTSLKNAITAYEQRTVYLTNTSKYVKTTDYLTEDLSLVEAKFDNTSLEAYITTLNAKTEYTEANTKEEVLNVLNAVIELFKNIDVTIKDINTKTTSEISEYKSFSFLEDNVKDEIKLLNNYLDNKVTSEQFEVEYVNRINLISNSAISRLNIFNQADDVIHEAFLRYDYIVDIYTVLTNIIHNGKLGDPTKE